MVYDMQGGEGRKLNIASEYLFEKRDYFDQITHTKPISLTRLLREDS